MSFSVILRSVQLAVYTYSFAAHALSNEKISRNQDFALFLLNFVLCRQQVYNIQHLKQQLALNVNCIFGLCIYNKISLLRTDKMDFNEIKNTADKYLMPTYGHFPIALTGGKNASLTASDGRVVIDFTSGIGVNIFGVNDDGWKRLLSGR